MFGDVRREDEESKDEGKTDAREERHEARGGRMNIFLSPLPPLPSVTLPRGNSPGIQGVHDFCYQRLQLRLDDWG